VGYSTPPPSVTGSSITAPAPEATEAWRERVVLAGNSASGQVARIMIWLADLIITNGRLDFADAKARYLRAFHRTKNSLLELLNAWNALQWLRERQPDAPPAHGVLYSRNISATGANHYLTWLLAKRRPGDEERQAALLLCLLLSEQREVTSAEVMIQLFGQYLRAEAPGTTNAMARGFWKAWEQLQNPGWETGVPEGYE